MFDSLAPPGGHFFFYFTQRLSLYKILESAAVRPRRIGRTLEPLQLVVVVAAATAVRKDIFLAELPHE